AGVNIPMCFSYYNDKHLSGRKSFRSYLLHLGGMDGGTPSYASLCVDCGKCEELCPQDLPIRKHLQEVAKDMEKLYFKPAVHLVQWYYSIRRFLKKIFK
ncbi:MAG TPA: 4Fe-4S dicluster domain-containing protein, partial [Halanaerobiales bacterium]|nr:4Fe-4S dicluster domain-containing protein [Halanaerobiales bacterium]